MEVLYRSGPPMEVDGVALPAPIARVVEGTTTWEVDPRRVGHEPIEHGGCTVHFVDLATAVELLVLAREEAAELREEERQPQDNTPADATTKEAGDTESVMEVSGVSAAAGVLGVSRATVDRRLKSALASDLPESVRPLRWGTHKRMRTKWSSPEHLKRWWDAVNSGQRKGMTSARSASSAKRTRTSRRRKTRFADDVRKLVQSD